MDVALVLFTRDLRVRDNPALAGACARARLVLPLFVVDPTIKVPPNRARFLAESVAVPAGELRPAAGDHYRVFTPYWHAWQAAAWRQPHEAPSAVCVPAGSRPGAAGSRTWARDPDALDAWREGRSGIPIVDAGLRQFAAEGLSCSLDSEFSYTILSSSGILMVRVEDAEVCGRAGVTPPGPDGSRGESYPLSVSEFDARKGRRVPEGLAAATARWRKTATGRRGCPSDQAAEDRSQPPAGRCSLSPSAEERFMHNRARMITASFLTRTLGIDWRPGYRHFAGLLADGDVANNAGNWQRVAGTGNNRRPGRVLNPLRQAERFDRDGDYVRRYVPELASLKAPLVHTPWMLPEAERQRLGYPGPVTALLAGHGLAPGTPA